MLLIIAGILSSSTRLQAAKSNPEIRPLNVSKDSARDPKQKYKALRKLAFEPRQELSVRWKALMSLALLGREESIPDLEAAIRSEDWYMRDAGLQALVKVAPTVGRIRARQLLSDPALVVRTSAVLAIRELGDQESVDLLWGKLYAPQNFKGAKSLWIRKHIVETISALKSQGSRERFVKLLDDSDVEVAAAAVRGLEGITGLKLGQSTDSPSVKASHWRRWASSQKSLTR